MVKILIQNGIAQLLQENLEDAGVEDDDVTAIVEIVATTLPDIVFTEES